MRPVRDLKNFVHRMQAMPGSAAYRKACESALPAGQQRIYHFHVRKTAGTSLNQAFLSIGGEPGETVYKRLVADPNHRALSGGRAFVGWVWGLIEQGRYHFAFSHYAAHRLRLPRGTFTVTCLRDPVARALSYYSMLCEMRDAGSTHGELQLARPWLGESFGEFMREAPAEVLSAQLAMFSERLDVQEAVDRALACDAVLLTEQFASDLDALANRLKLTLPVLHVRPTQKKPALSAEVMDQARSVLAKEYEFISAVRAQRGS